MVSSETNCAKSGEKSGFLLSYVCFIVSISSQSHLLFLKSVYWLHPICFVFCKPHGQMIFSLHVS